MTTFRDFLLEGGAAIKGVEKITQEEVRSTLPNLIKKISSILGLKKSQIKVVGSAGKKEDGLLSGDIDIAVEIDRDELEGKLARLAWDEKSARAMRGINIFSFAHQLDDPDGNPGKLVQIDLIPTKDVDYTAWSMQSNPADLEKGLKGSHRNELMFAVAKYAGMKEQDDNIERYFYDLSRGLYKGVQSKNKKGTGYNTVSKEFMTNDIGSVVKTLYGQRASAESCATFHGCLDHINSEDFPHGAVRDKILAMASKGMTGKGLKVPPELQK